MDMCFQKIHRLKKDSDPQRGIQQKVTAILSRLLQSKGHFDYLNGKYPLSTIRPKLHITFKCIKCIIYFSILISTEKTKILREILGFIIFYSLITSYIRFKRILIDYLENPQYFCQRMKSHFYVRKCEKGVFFHRLKRL